MDFSTSEYKFPMAAVTNASQHYGFRWQKLCWLEAQLQGALNRIPLALMVLFGCQPAILGLFPTQVAHTRFLLCSGVPLPFLFMLPFLQHLPSPPAPTSGLHPASCTVPHPPLLLESMQLLLWPPDDPRFHLLPAWFLSPNEVIKFLGSRDLNANNFERLGHFPHLPRVHRYDIQNPFCSPSQKL